MSFEDVIRNMLPPRNGVEPHVTGHFGEHRASGPHGGSDFNYEGGQTGLNLQHPTVYAPIAGEVVFSGGQFGTVKIRDADGNTHEVLHLQDRSVAVGDRIDAGDSLGTMGGRGPRGADQYAQHVHYQMKDAEGRQINPEAWWDARVAANDQGGATEDARFAAADSRLGPVSARLLSDSEREIRAFAERHSLPWDQGMDNTVCAAALCARKANLTEVNLFNVRNGELMLGQHDGLTLRDASLDARWAANIPQGHSLSALSQLDSQTAVVGELPPAERERSLPVPESRMAL